MSKWLPVFLCCFSANAFASSADSGRCPWKIPFTITIHGNGSLHKYAKDYFERSGQEKDTDFGATTSTDDFDFTVDTSIAYLHSISYHADINDELHYSLNADTLRFFYRYDDTSHLPAERMSLLIAFAPGKDSIISLNCSKTDSSPPLVFYEDVESYSFSISSVSFDDTSIYADDSSITGHAISTGDVEMQLSQVTAQPDDFMQYAYSDFIASSVDLSGIFPPTHFADPSSVVEEVPPQTKTLSVTSMNGGLCCSFGTSNEERLLEIYSPLGIRTASCSVSPGQSQAVIPRITPGFYFVRLGNSLAKVFVAE